MAAPGIWWDKMWSLVHGCTKVSPGCANCCAENRFANYYDRGRPYLPILDTSAEPHWNGVVELREDLWGRPVRAPSRRYFVSGMGDLFHPAVPDAFINKAFDVMKTVDRHQYLVLTKRVERLRDVAKRLGTVPGHILLGASIEDQLRADERLPILTDIHRARLWVNCEPLLGPVDLEPYIHRLSWVTCGPEEHGPDFPRARPMKPAWATALRNQCNNAEIPFFGKDILFDGVEQHDFFEPERERSRRVAS